MVFHGSRLVFHGFFSKMYPPKLYPGPMIQSRSARRVAQDLVTKKISNYIDPEGEQDNKEADSIAESTSSEAAVIVEPG